MQGKRLGLTAAIAIVLVSGSGVALVGTDGQGILEGTPGAENIFASDAGEAACEDKRPHPPIRIHDDAMFRLGPAVGVVNPAALGTADDPYVIKGWCIQPTEGPSMGGSGILVEDTSAHVVIRDNVVDAHPRTAVLDGQDRQDFGIELRGAENVTVAENAITDHDQDGVHIEAVRQVHVANNTITNHDGEGIRVLDSRATSVVGNQLEDNGFGGLRIVESVGIHVENNTVEDNDSYGAAVFHSSGVVFSSNDISNSDTPSLGLVDSSEITLRGNALGTGGLVILGSDRADYEHTITPSNTAAGEPIRYVRGGTGVDVPRPAGQVVLVDTVGADVRGVELSGVPTGLQLAFTRDTTVDDVTVTNSHGFGAVSLVHAKGATISDSEFTENIDGISISRSSDATIRGNTIRSNDFGGISVGGNAKALIEGNTIVGNGFGGVYLHGTAGTVVQDNEIRSNDDGIRVDGSTGATISQNTIERNHDDGVHLRHTDDAQVENNTVQRNGRDGVFMLEARGTTVANNTLQDNGQGVFVSESDELAVTSNEVHGNGGGIFLYRSSDVSVHRNEIQENRGEGLGINGGAGTVDVRSNWWGAPSGPSGGAADACTGALADGTGDEIDTSSTGKVCFDPWLKHPLPGAGPG